MNSEDADFIEAQGFCQSRLGRIGGGQRPLEPREIEEVVDEITSMKSFARCDRGLLISALQERFTVFTGDHGTLGEKDDHVAWLPSRREEIQWRFRSRYLLYLNSRIPASALDSINNVTEDVLERLEDPLRPGPWDRRGLVMGHVQSGKTANYCGLICKAIDSGYKVIIVLAGIHNNLRSQTQIRIEEGVLGRMSTADSGIGGETGFKPIGVGLLDQLDVHLRSNTGTTRHELGDFNKQAAKNFGIHAGSNPLVLVVKKHVGVLKRVINWIKSQDDVVTDIHGRKYIRNIPALVIDDEADQASVDTKLQYYDEDGKPDENHNPAKTNESIRKILHAFEKVAYVGYTATPFANIYIHEKGRTKVLGDDLFPRSFIVNIPAPSNYMGPKRIFGIPDDESAGLVEMEPLPIVRSITDHAATTRPDESNGWMPPRLVAKTQHIPVHEGRKQVPPSLRQAIMVFMISSAVRKQREKGPIFNSMLVHVVRFANVQKEVADQVEQAVKEIKMRLVNGDGERKPSIQDEFKALWEDEKSGFVATTNRCATILENEALVLPEWNNVFKALSGISEGIRIKVVNGSYGDILDYEEHKNTGLDVIMVGGDKLSRGLTLEGLTVSYFLRASRMYDTLMQMGRWFGYREKYIDLCRLYTTADLLEWFAHIATASEELQHEFQHMVRIGATPKDYGLKVRSHPAMLVTSAVKMRHGTELKFSYSGDISETIVFSADKNWVIKNHRVVEHWLNSLGACEEPGSKDKGYGWKTSSENVLEFLSDYTSHDDARRANTALLSKYIRTQNEQNELTEWTVRLISSSLGDATEHNLGEFKVGLIKRKLFLDNQDENKRGIRRLVSPTDELYGLTTVELEQAKQKAITNWKNDLRANKRKDPPRTPGGSEIRDTRDKRKGLLLLYPLDQTILGMKDGTPPILGLAISFPNSKTAKQISYVVNSLYQQDDDSI